MATSLKLQQLLQQSSEEKKEQDVQFQVKQAALQLESDILATSQSLAKAEKTRATTVISELFSAGEIINADISIEGLKDGLKRLNALKTELF